MSAQAWWPGAGWGELRWVPPTQHPGASSPGMTLWDGAGEVGVVGGMVAHTGLTTMVPVDIVVRLWCSSVQVWAETVGPQTSAGVARSYSFRLAPAVWMPDMPRGYDWGLPPLLLRGRVWVDVVAVGGTASADWTLGPWVLWVRASGAGGG